MSPRELDDLGTDVDDATTIVEELQNDPNVQAPAELAELRETLEEASDTIDELENDAQ